MDTGGVAATGRVGIPFLLALALSTCGPSDVGHEDGSVGVLVGWRDVTLSHVGVVTDLDLALPRLGRVVIGADERLYVPQRDDDAIRVHEPGGRLLTTIGRRGQGPGEFRSLGDIGLIGDTLYALDSGKSQVSLFDLDGRVLTSRSFRPRTFPTAGRGFAIVAPAVPQTFVLRPDGTSLVRPSVLSSGGGAPPEPAVVTEVVPVPLLHLDERSLVLDTVVWEARRGSSLFLPHGGEVFRVSVPFSDEPLFTLMPDGSGVVVVDRLSAPDTRESAFTVTLIGPGRDTVYSRSFSYRPLVLADADVRLALERAPLSPVDHPDPPPVAAIEEALRSVGLVPATRTPVSHVSAGQDGSVWLRREETGGSVAWDVVDEKGRPAGRLHLPGEQTVVAARGSLMVALAVDAPEGPRLVAYRLLR